MRAVAIIQARMGSTRLPGKVMKTLCGKTILGHVIERVKAASGVEEVVVATTTKPDDDVIVAEAKECGALAFRGSEEDVLARYYLAAKECKADVVIRVTSDCPLFDPQLLEKMLKQFQSARATEHAIDYLSNTLKRSYPRGLDVEVFTFAALERAHREADKPYEREHVTPYIYQHPGIFSLHEQVDNEDLSSYRWTLDTEEDLELIKGIYSMLYEEDRIFTSAEAIELFRRRPELASINADIEQKKLEG